tara:strand:- start:555 stop:770 length:216 start_codon:yes stop_codon:yes gene_type:complete
MLNLNTVSPYIPLMYFLRVQKFSRVCNREYEKSMSIYPNTLTKMTKIKYSPKALNIKVSLVTIGMTKTRQN